ncbi:MAG: hypothetical protein V4668_01490 [Patescibacteria group bacterium]
MSFEFNFKSFTKKEVSQDDQEIKDAQIIANIKNELETEGIAPTEVFKIPKELHADEILHKVQNEPRMYEPEISPDSVIPPKPPQTL